MVYFIYKIQISICTCQAKKIVNVTHTHYTASSERNITTLPLEPSFYVTLIFLYLIYYNVVINVQCTCFSLVYEQNSALGKIDRLYPAL